MIAIAASAFLFLALITGATALFGSRMLSRSAEDARVRGLRPARGDDRDSPADAPTLKRRYASISKLGRFLRGSSADSVALQLQQANVQLRVSEFVLVRVLLAVVFFLVTFLILSRFQPLALVIGLGTGIGGYLLPPFYLRFLQGRRIAKIEEQLVEFAPMLASSLRAGFAFQQGVELAARQLPSPLADELTLFINDTNIGSSTEDALLDMGSRVGSTALDMMITAILVQRTSGGNLSEILDQTAETLRERERIRGDVKTLTASGRMTGLILSVYPAGVGLLLLLIMPSIWSVLFTEMLGRIVLGVGLSLQILGYFVMGRVMRIEV